MAGRENKLLQLSEVMRRCGVVEMSWVFGPARSPIALSARKLFWPRAGFRVYLCATELYSK